MKVHYCASDDFTASLTEASQNANQPSLLSTEGPLGTEFKRQTFYRCKFTVIEVVKYALSQQTRSHTVFPCPGSEITF